MGKIVMSMSMSLDGFVAAKNASPEQPLGEDGQRLHEWYFSDDADEYNEELEEDMAGVGAVIVGRRSYETSLAWDFRGKLSSVPCIVLTSLEHIPSKEEIDAACTFVSDGIESALSQARDLAGDKDIAIIGANVQQQFIVAGLMDEINVDIVPVLLCEGIRLFDYLGGKHISLEQIAVGEGDQVAHLTYSIIK